MFDRKKVQISVSFVNTIFKIRIRKRNPQPATFFENNFLYVGGVGEVWKRQVHFLDTANKLGEKRDCKLNCVSKINNIFLC